VKNIAEPTSGKYHSCQAEVNTQNANQLTIIISSQLRSLGAIKMLLSKYENFEFDFERNNSAKLWLKNKRINN
jgi:hypothetical protein